MSLDIVHTHSTYSTFLLSSHDAEMPTRERWNIGYSPIRV